MVPGSRCGHYEIIGPLGSGGMGEVYRAHDTRMHRDVALKILPRMLASDPDNMRRFEQEALAAGMLNHPNVLTVFDVGNHEGIPFIVSEVLEGTSLRELLVRPLPLERAVDYAQQIAHGLSAAHAKGIVHRDIKPENIFVVDERRVKLLDFGLVKLTRPEALPHDVTVAVGASDPGVVVGTTAYMSPEQVRGRPVDHRSDIFSFGVVLHEMLTGMQLFRRDNAVETMMAIVHEEPAIPDTVPRAVAGILRHALEKNPEHRWGSARDMAYALEALSDRSGVIPTRRKRERAVEKPRPIDFKRITFRRGFITNARFAPGGSLIYGAAWEDEPFEVYSTLPPNPESRPLALKGSTLLAVSVTGEMAISLDRRYVAGYVMTGTLARVALGGGAPRAVCEDVQDADWTPDGRELLVARRSGGVYRVESPIGNVIHETPVWISNVRFSPDGKLIAFIEHPIWGDDGGHVVIIDLKGTIRARSPQPFSTTGGLAWTPRGDEVWVAASPIGGRRDLYALSTSGKPRLVHAMIGAVSLHDIAPGGEVLMANESARREIVGGRLGQDERNLSWFDWSWLGGISWDGEFVVIEEQAAAARGTPLVYVRPLDGRPAIRLGEGRARGSVVSPDGKWLATGADDHSDLILLPLGTGQPRRIASHLATLTSWTFYPDGKRLLVAGHEAGAERRLWELSLDGGAPRPIATDTVEWALAISPSGEEIAVVGAGGAVLIYPSQGGQSRRAPGCVDGRDVPAGWSANGRDLYVYTRGRHDVGIDRVDVETGDRERLHRIRPADPAGVQDIMPVQVAPGGTSYVYGYRRFLSELYVVQGLL